MKIAGLADIHSDTAAIARVRPAIHDADVILLVGDITHFGKGPDIARIIAAFSNQAADLMAVSGNCDYPDVDGYLYDVGINLHGKAVVLEKIVFVGLGGSLITPFNTPNEYTENEIDAALQKSIKQAPPDLPMVLVAHQPPYQTTCDRLSSGKHVGSRALRAFIEQYQPLVCFTGHIHEAMGVDQIGVTPVINPGRLGRGYFSFARVGGSLLQDYGIQSAEMSL